MTEFEYEVPPPGYFIQMELDARGWMQRDLAFILGIEETALSRIINGKTGVSLEMSKALGTAFNIDADFFANLQKTYDLAHTPDPDPAIARRALLQSKYPVREMIKRGWLKNMEVSLLEIHLKRFLRANDDNDVLRIRHAAKKTNAGEPVTESQLAWLYRVVQLAEALDCKAYNERALSDAVPKLRRLMARPEDTQQVPQILAACGLRFVIVEGLTGAKIDGVCIWLSPDTPIVAVSFRYDRNDNFWFVLWHELAHVLNRHGQDESAWIVDVELEGDRASDSATNSKQEREANRKAADWCIPTHEMTQFVSRRTFFSERDVVAFAKRMHVHPGIVVGQIHNRTGRYELLRRLQVRVRDYILPAAMVDGWGHVAQISL
jgi:HTH-type transcriptional regulator / antitoxin HigA